MLFTCTCLTLVPVHGQWNWKIYPCGLNKGFGSKFCVGTQVWHKTPEEDWSTLTETSEYNNEVEDNSLNTQTDKNAWPGVVAPDKGPVYGLNKTKLWLLEWTVLLFIYFILFIFFFLHLNCIFMLNWIV